MDLNAYYEGSERQGDLVERLMVNLLSLLRAQYWVYQTAHWTVKGTGYYGDHLLFQRLYEGVQAEIDVLAEKMVGHFGIHAVEPSSSMDATQEWVDRWSPVEDQYMRALSAEQDMQETFKAAYDAITEAGGMTLGLDDWIMATANAHETHGYLLQQRRLPKQAAVESGPAAPSSEGAFFDNPEKRGVRELAETKALSNDPAVVEQSKEQKGTTPSRTRSEVQKAKGAPPTPTEIEKGPGGKDFSTLNRFVVETAEPVEGVPKGHGEVPKHDDALSKRAADALMDTYWRR